MLRRPLSQTVVPFIFVEILNGIYIKSNLITTEVNKNVSHKKIVNKNTRHTLGKVARRSERPDSRPNESSAQRNLESANTECLAISRVELIHRIYTSRLALLGIMGDQFRAVP